MLDATVVNVALPRLGADLDAGFSGLQWVVNAYTLTLAAFILLGGSLGDHYGRRKIFQVGVTWFALASVLCGLAPTVELLAVGRALQGVGGALLTPGSLAIIAATFDPADRSRAVGAWSALGGVAGAVGPFAGGWLVEWNWRAVFLVNLPFAAVVLLVSARHVPESRDESAPKRIDIPGSVLAAAGLGLLTYGLIRAGAGLDALVVGTVVAGAALLAAFVLVQRRSDHPLVPLDMFASRRFTAINLVTFATYAALGVFFFLLVLHLQVVAGFSPLLAGTAMLPATVLMLLLSARAGALADRVGARPLLIVGLLFAAAGALLTLRVDEKASYVVDVLPAVVVFGLGLSTLVAPLTATVLSSAPPGHSGVASGVNNAVARVAGLLAVAVIPVVAGLAGANYTDVDRFASGFRTAMLICAGLLLAGAALAAVMIRPEPRAAPAPDVDVSKCTHCGFTAPQLQPNEAAR
ncbi:MFS transporter [Virgisporangium aurantiacum]|uniref:MFS transporter n=2 Tax=Virgisporangium aurantiacum TaxID=175570 RepID=A0A8J3Z6E9_9ACTN|nr:MFS transporter [Virgisporangium aurantiacum]